MADPKIDRVARRIIALYGRDDPLDALRYAHRMELLVSSPSVAQSVTGAVARLTGLYNVVCLPACVQDE